MLKDPSQRGLVRIVQESQDAQAALGGHLARKTLANALCQRALEQMIEAWALLLAHYSPSLARLGKRFARIAAVDASLLKLSLEAFDWAQYRAHSGAAKITCVFDWIKGVPQQFVFTAAGKIHDLKATSALAWSAGWTYLFDRGYFSFDLLGALLTAGAHFVIRLKDRVEHRILERHEIPDLRLPAGMRAIRSDWTVVLPGWDRDLILRLVSYQLTDGKLIRVLTDRHDLSALSIALLYKERWTIENWWRWPEASLQSQRTIGAQQQCFTIADRRRFRDRPVATSFQTRRRLQGQPIRVCHDLPRCVVDANWPPRLIERSAFGH